MLRSVAVLLMLSSAALAEPTDGETLKGMTWDQIVAESRGGTVNWFMWGGSDTINAYVSGYVADRLKAEYDITLNRIPITDAADIVNQVLAEKEAGVSEAGSVDLIWINGENFRSMKQADLVFCGYTGLLPNDALVNWENPAIANDFGVPVDGCEVPWNTVQFAFAHDSAKVAEPPRDMAALLAWIKANPGRFTYPAPPDFTGSAFLRHVFIHAAGGPDSLLGPFDQAKFDDVSARTWAILNEVEPFLWREGATYPTTVTQLNELFANGEIDFSFNYDPAQFGLAVQAGIWPDTTRSYGLSDGTIGNTNYTLIPFNSPNKAAAMVVQNLLLSGEAQLEKAKTEVWGAAPAIEVGRTAPDVQDGFAAIKTHPSVVPASE
ncbi:MAG TPA: ABC transporter substrate-binding protein, partial [Tabrizicola sp.]|nr:ABC transporter substrate-binding protein [Tabrizicola sp.]